MKCFECRMPLKYCYYSIGNQSFCKSCALEFFLEIQDFKVEIPQKSNYKEVK